MKGVPVTGDVHEKSDGDIYGEAESRFQPKRLFVDR